MPWHLGIDEAGLGPTLGPLCWGLCRWEHPGREDDQLWSQLAPLVTAPGQGGSILLGDSKILHRGKHRLAKLESQVLTWVRWVLGEIPHKFQDLWTRLIGPAKARCTITQKAHPPWLRAAFAYTLPLRACPQEIRERAQALDKLAQKKGLAHPQLSARVLCAPAYNASLAQVHRRGGTKNNLVGEHVIDLARGQILATPAPLSIIVDKLGGRNRYLDLLRERSGIANIETLVESGAQSCYAGQSEHGHRVSIAFVSKSESIFPSVALAACLAKYLREVVMTAFCSHFSAKFPQIRPTAGYPQDAKRFLSELSAHPQSHLDVSPGPQGWSSCDWVRRA